MNDTLAALTVIFIAVLAIVIGPLLLLWSLNTLFPVLAIPYTVETWFAALFTSAAIKSTVTVGGKK